MKRGHFPVLLNVLCPFVILLLAVVAPAARAQTGPSITEQPASQTVLAGTNVMLSVGVSGSGPFIYQWQFNGTNLLNDIITTVAGDGISGFPGDGGPATNASLTPASVAVDASNNLYIADPDKNLIRKVYPNGIITTVPTNVALDIPSGVAVDASGNLLIAESGGNIVWRLDSSGVLAIVAGTGATGYSGDGGPATNANLDFPESVAVDASGNLFIADQDNGLVRKVDTNGIITTVAGNYFGSRGYSGDGGPATNATLLGPCGVAVDGLGNLIISDTFNYRVRRVDKNGIITTIAGNGKVGRLGDGGPATNAEVNLPYGIAIDASGDLFIADRVDNRIRKVDTNGIITTVAGTGVHSYSGDGGAATNANLNNPIGVALDASGNLYIADYENNRVRMVDFGGVPNLAINNVLATNAGEYQVVVTSPYGSVTSAVATITVAPFVLEMTPPVVAGTGLLLGFSLVPALSPSFTLFQSASITGPWTTNTAAVLSTNAQATGYQFTLPVPGSTEFYQVRSP
jgi:sugar lactone lactonase YvrE